MRNVIDDYWLDILARAIDRDIENPGPFFHGYDSPDGGQFHGNLRIWQNDPVFEDFCLNSPLPALARSFLDAKKLSDALA